MSNDTSEKDTDAKENNPKGILKSTKGNVSDNPKEKPNKKTNKVQFNEEKNQYLNSDYHILIPADLDELDEISCDCDDCYYNSQYEAGLYDDCDSWDSVDYPQYDYCSSFRGRSSHDNAPETPAIISPPNGYKDPFSFPPQRVTANTADQDTGLFRGRDWPSVEERSSFGNVAPQMVSTFKPVPASSKPELTARPSTKSLIFGDAKSTNAKPAEYESSRSSNSEYHGRPPAENIYANLGNRIPLKPDSAIRQLFPQTVGPGASVPSHGRQNYSADGHSRAFSCGDIQIMHGTGGDLQDMRGTSGDLQGARRIGGDLQGMRGTSGDLQGMRGTSGDLEGMRGTGGDLQGMRGTSGDLQGMRGTSGDLQGMRGTGGDLQGMRGTGSDWEGMRGTGGDLEGMRGTGGDVQGMRGTSGDIQSVYGTSGYSKNLLWTSSDMQSMPGTSGEGRGSLASDDEDVPQTDLLRKTIERSTLRRNFGRRAEGKSHPKPAGMSLEERIKQLTCYVDEDEANENSENVSVADKVGQERYSEVCTSEEGTSKSELAATVKSEDKLAIKVLEAECKKSKGGREKPPTSGYKKFTNFFSRNKCENAKRNEEAKKLFQSKLKEEMDEKKNAKLKCDAQNATRDVAEKGDAKKENATKTRNVAEKCDAKKDITGKPSTVKGDIPADDDQSDYGFFNRPPVLSVQPNAHLLQQMQLQLEQPSRGTATVENQNRYATTQRMFIPPLNAAPTDIRGDRVFCRVHELEIGTSAVTAVVPGREEIFSVPYAGQVKVLVGQNGYPGQVYNHFHARNDILVTENGHLYHTLPAKGQSSAAKFGYNTISYRVPQPTLSHCTDPTLGWAQAQAQAQTSQASEASSSRCEESAQKKSQK